MESLFPLLFGVVIAICGAAILLRRKTEIGFGGRAVSKPLFYLKLSRITAVILAVGFISGGIAIAFPSAYELLSAKPLQNDLPFRVPLIGLGLIVVGIVATAVSGVLGTAKSVGDTIYTQNKTHKPLFQRDDENKAL